MSSQPHSQAIQGEIPGLTPRTYPPATSHGDGYSIDEHPVSLVVGGRLFTTTLECLSWENPDGPLAIVASQLVSKASQGPHVHEQIAGGVFNMSDQGFDRSAVLFAWVLDYLSGRHDGPSRDYFELQPAQLMGEDIWRRRVLHLMQLRDEADFFCLPRLKMILDHWIRTGVFYLVMRRHGRSLMTVAIDADNHDSQFTTAEQVVKDFDEEIASMTRAARSRRPSRSFRMS